MPEQGPTEEEITAFLAGSDISLNMKRGFVRAALARIEPLTRARHVREAVEGMPSINAPEADFVCVEWMSERGYPFRVTMPRAALLDALGGTHGDHC